MHALHGFRMLGVSLVLVASLIAAATSCSSKSKTPDGGLAIDAPGTVTSLGVTCTGSGQGTCGAGFECVQLAGGSDGWCGQACTQATATATCGSGYTGPGFPDCFVQVTTGSGSAAMTTDYCGVVCEDDTGTHEICTAAACSGECPGTLQCTAELKSGSGTVVAHACQ